MVPRHRFCAAFTLLVVLLCGCISYRDRYKAVGTFHSNVASENTYLSTDDFVREFDGQLAGLLEPLGFVAASTNGELYVRSVFSIHTAQQEVDVALFFAHDKNPPSLVIYDSGHREPSDLVKSVMSAIDGRLVSQYQAHVEYKRVNWDCCDM